MILVTGANGQVGTALRSVLSGASFWTRRELDLRFPASIRPLILAAEPSVVINCAAYTAVDRAEAEPELAFTVNGEAVGELAEACRIAGARFVTLSTDYVFDGESPHPYVESSPTNPVSAYGRSKLDGEERARAAHADTLVIRTSWVLSGTHPNFVATMLRLSRERSLRVVDDQRGHPTLASDLAVGVAAAATSAATGVLHLTNADVVTWYDLAREALAIAGRDTGMIEPCSTAEYPTPAQRPANSVLESERLPELGIGALPSFRIGLPGLIADLDANGLA